MSSDTDHSINSGLLDDKQLREARAMFDRLCLELRIVNHSARDMAAGLMISMFANGERDLERIRAAIQRFAAELPASNTRTQAAPQAANDSAPCGM